MERTPTQVLVTVLFTTEHDQGSLERTGDSQVSGFAFRWREGTDDAAPGCPDVSDGPACQRLPLVQQRVIRTARCRVGGIHSPGVRVRAHVGCDTTRRRWWLWKKHVPRSHRTRDRANDRGPNDDPAGRETTDRETWPPRLAVERERCRERRSRSGHAWLAWVDGSGASQLGERNITKEGSAT